MLISIEVHMSKWIGEEELFGVGEWGHGWTQQRWVWVAWVGEGEEQDAVWVSIGRGGASRVNQGMRDLGCVGRKRGGSMGGWVGGWLGGWVSGWVGG